MKSSGGAPSDSQRRRGGPFVPVHGMFLEKADQESELMLQMRSSGVHILAMSGNVNLRVRDPFDEIKVVVKRGEVDWVHIVLVPSWVSHQTVLTKIVKLCRVAHRRQILWSVGNPAQSLLWTSPLWDVGTVHQVVRSGLQVVINVHWWSPDMDGPQVVLHFKESLNMQAPDHKVTVSKHQW